MKEFNPSKSWFNISIFVILVFVTVTGVFKGGFQVIKVTSIPLILSAFVVFGKKNKLILDDKSLTLKKQFMGIFYFKDIVIEYNQVKSLEEWSIMGASRLTFKDDEGNEIYNFKAGEIDQKYFGEILKEIEKRTKIEAQVS